MKRHILLATMLLAGMSAFAQTGYMKDIEVSGREVRRVGDEVRVTMRFDLSDVKMKRQHTTQLVPVLVSKDGRNELELPSVVLNGRIRNRAIRRQEALTGKPVYEHVQTTVRRKNGEAQTVSYEATAPFARWMYDSRLEVREAVTGCADCGEGGETSTLDPLVLVRFVPDYRLTLQEPAPEPVKRRDEVRSARLQYRQDSYTTDPKFKDNARELADVQASIDAVKDNKDLTITGIYVTGYASPEGTVAYNLKLSERRAKTFTDYVKKQNTGIPASLWYVDWKGEDWEGLREEVQKHPRLLKIDEVLAIIDGCDGDRDACEEQLKALVPPQIYERLLNEMYGPLRRNEYRIEYNVRNFNLEEARQLLRKSPKLLSLNEMYQVAGSYGKGTAEYNEAMDIAARTYPENPVALGNAAVTKLEQNEVRAAIALLEGKQLDASAKNTLGVAYAKAGEYAKAKALLEASANEGNTDARTNLEQLLKVMEQL